MDHKNRSDLGQDLNPWPKYPWLTFTASWKKHTFYQQKLGTLSQHLLINIVTGYCIKLLYLHVMLILMSPWSSPPVFTSKQACVFTGTICRPDPPTVMLAALFTSTRQGLSEMRKQLLVSHWLWYVNRHGTYYNMLSGYQIFLLYQTRIKSVANLNQPGLTWTNSTDIMHLVQVTQITEENYEWLKWAKFRCNVYKLTSTRFVYWLSNTISSIHSFVITNI